MTGLDRQVAKLRGWKWHGNPNNSHGFWITDESVIVKESDGLPSTNLLQAYKLWDEARPEGWRLWTIQGDDNVWQVGRKLREQAYHAKFVSFTDLPRAITQSWIDAMNKE